MLWKDAVLLSFKMECFGEKVGFFFSNKNSIAKQLPSHENVQKFIYRNGPKKGKLDIYSASKLIV